LRLYRGPGPADAAVHAGLFLQAHHCGAFRDARSAREARDLPGAARPLHAGVAVSEANFSALTPARNPISRGGEWTFELIEKYDAEIRKVAIDEFGLDCYRNQIEIISSEQMLDNYASNGLPIGYPHWTYGKEFIRNEQSYRSGVRGLAYEI